MNRKMDRRKEAGVRDCMYLRPVPFSLVYIIFTGEGVSI